MNINADYFDGKSATAHHVKAYLDADALVFRLEDSNPLRWDLSAIEPPDKADMPYALRLIADDGTRLVIVDKYLALGLHPLLLRANAPRRNVRKKKWLAITLIVWLVAAVVWLGGGYITQALVAVLPMRFDEMLDNHIITQIDFIIPSVDPENNQAGMDALRDLVERLRLPEDTTPYRPHVLKINVINAFSLPAGSIIVTTGLLSDCQDSDELAAILAHEMAHARMRHGTQMLARALGLQLLFGMFGAAPQNYSNELMNLFMQNSWSRDVEREADNGMFEQLRHAGIRPDAIASFFDRLREKSNYIDLPAIISTHPDLADRIDKARAVPMYSHTPALSPEQWLAIKNLTAKKI
jgi:Zn-dependent protease with chaperone function